MVLYYEFRSITMMRTINKHNTYMTIGGGGERERNMTTNNNNICGERRGEGKIREREKEGGREWSRLHILSSVMERKEEGERRWRREGAKK